MWNHFDHFLAQASPAPQQGPWGMLIMLGLMFGIFYLLLWRPQMKEQKKKKQMLSELKKGDGVITRGGIHGTVTAVNQEKGTVTLKIGDNTRTTFNLDAVANRKEG